VAKIEEIMPFIDRYAVAYDHLQSYNTRFPDDLKKSILQMAIQGENWYLRIRMTNRPVSCWRKLPKRSRSWSRMGRSRSRSRCRRLRMREIPFDIPESWVWVRLGDLGDCKNRTDSEAL
jgi:type I restriction enzyme S subunit